MIALVAIMFLVIGLVRLARSLAMQSRGRAWTVMTGIVALLLGIVLWIGGPVAKLGLVALCIAVDFLCHGVSWSHTCPGGRKPLKPGLLRHAGTGRESSRVSAMVREELISVRTNA